ncbi:MAG TPA: GNAT family N-acetyltransferase [Parasegetibacter sp.]|jgi:hypothetical protein
MNKIIYLTRDHLNTDRYNRCISEATNGLIYAYSDYLDLMSVRWSALVFNDYEAVMPLPWNKKYGVHYIYNPAFTACLGVFGKNVESQLLKSFLDTIPRKFRYWDFSLNHGNFFELTGFSLYQRRNFILDLQNSYDSLFSKFNQNVKRNIARAQNAGCVPITDIPVEDVIQLAGERLNEKTGVKKEDFENFGQLYQLLHAHGKAKTYGIYHESRLMASAVFFFSHNRAYYILVGNHPNSRVIGASHFLINQFIKDYSGTNLILDFEGSDMHNLAFFYSSFGGVEEKYSAIRLNRLPFYLKWLKK